MTTTQFYRLSLIQQNRMRNRVGFVYMTPGVQGSVVPDGSDNVGATTQIRFGGGQQFEREVAVEGIPAGRTQPTGTITEAAPPVGVVREFKVTNSLMSAERPPSRGPCIPPKLIDLHRTIRPPSSRSLAA